MSPFRPSRERHGPDPYLPLKMAIFVIGAAFGLAGMAMDERWLILTGIAILAVGFLLRFLPRRDERGGEEDRPAE